MIRSRLWPTVGLVLILVAADGAAQTGAVKPSDVSPFMGTWVLTMTNLDDRSAGRVRHIPSLLRK